MQGKYENMHIYQEYIYKNIKNLLKYLIINP